MDSGAEGRKVVKCLDPLVIGLFGMCLKKLANMNVYVSASLNSRRYVVS